MSKVTLRPNGTGTNTGAVTGAASAHAALSDNSDSSYVTFDPDEAAQVALTDMTLPAGAALSSCRLRARVARPGAGPVQMGLSLGAGLLGVGGTSFDVNWNTPTEIGSGNLALSGYSDTPVDGGTIIVSAISGILVVYELYLDVTYVLQPVVDITAPTGTITNTNKPTVAWTMS